MYTLNAAQQQHLRGYFDENMGQVLLEKDPFERTLDVYQVVLAQIEQDPIRLARKRRKLSQAILDQEAYIVHVEYCLSCAAFDSILANAEKLIAMQPVVTSQELQFQSILDTVFSPYSSYDSRDSDANLSSNVIDERCEPLSGVCMDELLFLNNSVRTITSDSPIMPSSSSASVKAPYSTAEERWQAVLDHDRAANGHFVYCVRSTGIFCRPTCPSRRPLLTNVLFYSNNEEAEISGFRPCRRCKPQDLVSPSDLRQLAAVEMVKKEIVMASTHATKRPSLKYLASKAGMSSFHFHRVFKARTGLTLDEYRRLTSMRKESEG